MMEFGILKLKQNESYIQKEDELETALVILSGSGEIYFPLSNEKFLVKRKDTFDEPTTSFIIPKNHEYKINSLESLEIAVLKAKDEGSVFLVRHTKDINIDYFGEEKDNSKRKVFEYFGDSNAPKSNLVVGEVLSAVEGKTSVDPHHHPQWEVYHKRTDPADGKGKAQVGDEVFDTYNDTTILIPGGLVHPQKAGKNTREWYLWAIRHNSGEGSERWARASCKFDNPTHLLD